MDKVLARRTATTGDPQTAVPVARKVDPQEVTILASAARTATPAVVTRTRDQEIGLLLVVDLTAFTTAASLTPRLRFKDPLSGKTIEVLAATAIAAVGTTAYLVMVGAGAPAGGITLSRGFPILWEYEIEIFHGNANSHTYSVSLHLIRS